MTLTRVAQLLRGTEWTFAKTMPHNPHEYTLRKRFSNEEFDAMVTVMRGPLSYGGKFGGRTYLYLDVDRHYHWTMGDPLQSTVVLNRKPLEVPAAYDELAAVYDSIFDAEQYRKEEQAVADMVLQIAGGRTVLDVGCGTGWLSGYVENYAGYDPSPGMLAVARRKNPNRLFVNCAARAIVPPHDEPCIAVALFGAASYLTPLDRKRVRGIASESLMVYYQPGYTPKTVTALQRHEYAGWHGGKIIEQSEKYMVVHEVNRD